MKALVMTAIAAVCIAVVNSGCMMVSTELSKFGSYQIVVDKLEDARRDERQLILSCKGRYLPGDGGGYPTPAGTARFWATLPLEKATNKATWKYGKYPPYAYHMGELPSKLVEATEPVPIVQKRYSAELKSYQPATAYTVLYQESPGWLHIMATSTNGVTTISEGRGPHIDGRVFWAYPILWVGLPVTIPFDIVTFPFQIGPYMRQYGYRW